MNRKARITLASLGVTVACLGLTTVPAHAGPVVTLCNSGSSPHSQFGDFRIIDTSRGTNILVHAGDCKSVTNTTALRVKYFGSPIWRVRSVPGNYGICHGAAESNPGSQDKYSWWVAPSGC